MKSANVLPRILLFFWSCWFSLVTGSNLVDGLQQAGWVPADWPFASGNFDLIVETISIFDWSAGVAAILFVGVVAVEFGAAFLFLRAAIDAGSGSDAYRFKVHRAFGAAIALFAGFLIADELFIVYDRIGNLESSHFLVLCALLLSLLIIRLPPEWRKP